MEVQQARQAEMVAANAERVATQLAKSEGKVRVWKRDEKVQGKGKSEVFGVRANAERVAMQLAKGKGRAVCVSLSLLCLDLIGFSRRVNSIRTSLSPPLAGRV